MADGRAVLEAVARTAADEPDVLERGVTVDQKIAVRGVLVLADARLDERRVRERRDSLGQKAAHLFERLRGRHALRRVGVELRAVAVERDLDAAAFQIGQAVNFRAPVDPRGQRGGPEARVARRRAEEVDLLPRHVNAPRE